MIKMTVLPAIVTSAAVNWFLADTWVRWLQLEALVIPVMLLVVLVGWLIGEYFFGPTL